MVNFPTWIPDRDSTVLLFGIYFLLTLVFVLQWLFLHCEILIIWLFEFPLNFH